MTQPPVQDLSRAKIRRLLAAVGSLHTDENVAPDVVEYNWRDPHYFSEDQRNRLAAVMSQVAVLIAEKFTHFYNREFSVIPSAITQHFAADVYDLVDFEQSRSLTFNQDKNDACGFLAVTAATALKWVTHLLGDSEGQDDPNRVLSSLEESLLYDLAAGVVESFISPLCARYDLHPDKQVVAGQPSIQFELTEEICQVTFEIKEANSDQPDQARFVLPCNMLTHLANKKTQKKATTAAEELSRILMEHVHRMPVTVTATLSSTILKFAEIVDLHTDDVLLLTKTIDEPIDLLIDKRTVFRGRPAQSNGHYAVYLTESVQKLENKTSAPAVTS
jgi:flagellar motor switch protein FliM